MTAGELLDRVARAPVVRRSFAMDGRALVADGTIRVRLQGGRILELPVAEGETVSVVWPDDPCEALIGVFGAGSRRAYSLRSGVVIQQVSATR